MKIIKHYKKYWKGALSGLAFGASLVYLFGAFGTENIAPLFMIIMIPGEILGIILVTLFGSGAWQDLGYLILGLLIGNTLFYSYIGTIAQKRRWIFK